MQEKPHVLHILNLLKDLPSTAPSTDDEAPRLPAYTTLLLAHAFRALFYPSNFIYPLTARFLLQRPTLDSTDVPMLFGMLYSASDDWKKERAWIVRFLADGMVSSEEWRVLKRRHTWDLLASLLQSEERDRALRRGILEVRDYFVLHITSCLTLLVARYSRTSRAMDEPRRRCFLDRLYLPGLRRSYIPCEAKKQLHGCASLGIS